METLAVRATPLIVAVWPLVGLPVKVPVSLAAVGALASKVMPSMVNCEPPLMEDELSVPTATVKAAAVLTLPRLWLQSFFTPLLEVLREFQPIRGSLIPSEKLSFSDLRKAPVAATTGGVPMCRFACCIW